MIFSVGNIFSHQDRRSCIISLRCDDHTGTLKSAIFFSDNKQIVNYSSLLVDITMD